ncbi:AAA family ATPase [Phenylobacterium soli]|uniref:Pilus assembly protein CpaE n=1 Tax=Phenylobacterium soli TaxID=2170551 RepID=A0A328ABJ3_9CAUL|nr:AAA family ATPase [Phenylobacterium soli]RAK51827.1 pilus assembly protein CpaE [Phenylobacterium soli]
MGLPQPAARPAAAPAFLATVADEVTREAARQAAATLGWSQGRVREGGALAARQLLSESPASLPTVLLVDVSDSDEPLAAMEALAEVCDPATRVVALGQTNDVGLYRALLRMGVSDYLVKPVSAELLVEALRRAERAGAEPAPAAARAARLVAVIGARGGVGTTSLAVSAAFGLARDHGQRAVLLDLDLQFGAAALSLDLETGRGLREMLTNPERIDSLLISSAMTPAAERLRILGAEESLDEDVEIGPAGLEALTAALAEDCDVLVADLPRRMDGLARAAIARASQVVLVTDLSLAGLRDAQRLARTVRALAPAAELVLVANRVGGVAGEAPQAEFARALGAGFDVAVPADAKAAQAAAEQARPLIEAAAKSAAGPELAKLVARLAGEAAPAASPTPAAEPLTWLKSLLGR